MLFEVPQTTCKYIKFEKAQKRPTLMFIQQKPEVSLENLQGVFTFLSTNLKGQKYWYGDKEMIIQHNGHVFIDKISLNTI